MLESVEQSDVNVSVTKNMIKLVLSFHGISLILEISDKMKNH